jgi:hypothetical protein
MDNDGDNALDCADSDCQPTAACAPGSGAVGSACTANTQCAATDRDPLCFMEDGANFPGGYCSEFCNDGGTGCSGDGICVLVDGATNLFVCIQPCDPLMPTDCRPGYTCGTFGALSACVSPESGEQDCADFDDNDGDGLMDCADPGCQALPQCDTGTQLVGTPCTANTDCSAQGDDPVCLTEAVFGWPQGTCSEFCSTDLGEQANPDCQPGSICTATAETGVGVCIRFCTVPSDCRAGYSCVDQACRPSCSSASQCPQTGYCETDDVADQGLCLAPVCGDRVVEGTETCDPPDGLGCSDACASKELACGNFEDDDRDTLLDCLDPDCAAACAGGTVATGAPCTSQQQCASTGADPACVPEQFGWTEGYCTERCDPAAQTGCTGTAVCVSFGEPRGYCLKPCTGRADCRTGYDCSLVLETEEGSGTTVRACVPEETDCEDLRDTDSDGLADCSDSDCADDPACTNGTLPAGSECTSTSQCQATAGADPVCIGEATAGWPRGMCSEFCVPGTDTGCAAGFECVALEGLVNGICVQTCPAAPCRAGYACREWSDTDPSTVCVPGCTTNAQCPVTGTCDDGNCVVGACGNNNREGTEECDGTDTTGGVCSPLCVLTPTAWTCNPAFYGDGDCDCGCGAVDTDCTSALPAACTYCDTPGSCSAQPCGGNTALSSTDNSQCVNDVCGNNVREGTEQCDGADVEPGFVCNAACNPIPPEWTCALVAYGDGLCDCGCGVVDTDCGTSNLADCYNCTQPGSCTTQYCYANNQLFSNNNAICNTQPDRCGNGVMEGTEECDGLDTPLGAFCGTSCMLVPTAWTCQPSYFADFECDCGCGARDVDCADDLLTSCEFCDNYGSCSSAECVDNTDINPTNSAVCIP